ncbi:DUF5018 domain-containing protein [Marinoscillum furvescens]|nr:DUF5018 domain-containing protein [Marinoscillum furvescens]
MKNLMSKFSVLLLALSMVVFVGCKDDEGDDGPLLSKRKDIVAVDLAGGCLGGDITGTVNAENFTVRITVPFGTDVKALAPILTISEKATVNPASETPQDFTTPVTYTVTAEDGTTQEWIVIVEIAAQGTEPVLTLSEAVWSYTIAGSNLPDWFTNNGEDGIAYGNGHVYVMSNHDKIKVLDPADGAVLADLDNSNISGGSLKLGDVETSADGSILACNVLDFNGQGTAVFKVYKWANESAAPEVYIEYEVSEAVRLGDNLSVVGDISGDAAIYTAYGRNFTAGERGSDIYRWEVKGGVLNPTPTIIKAQGFNSLTGFGSRAAATSLTADSETVWVNGNDIDVAEIDLATGAKLQQLPNENRDLVDFFYNDFTLFQLCDKTVMAAIFPRSANESRLLVIDVTDGLDNVTSSDVMYSADFVGSNTTANNDASGNVAHHIVSEAKAELYIVITNQALAKFDLTLAIQD